VQLRCGILNLCCSISSAWPSWTDLITRYVTATEFRSEAQLTHPEPYLAIPQKEHNDELFEDFGEFVDGRPAAHIPFTTYMQESLRVKLSSHASKQTVSQVSVKARHLDFIKGCAPCDWCDVGAHREIGGAMKGIAGSTKCFNFQRFFVERQDFSLV